MFKKLLSFTFILLIALLGSVHSTSVFSALPDIVVDKTDTPIDPDREEVFYTFFHYGSMTSKDDIKNSSIKVSINGAGVELMEAEMRDMYYIGDDISSKVPVCNATFGGSRFIIPYDLTNDGMLIYGPQSANKKDQIVGTQSSNLPAGHSGCIQVGLKLTGEITEGVVDIIFDGDRLDSVDYDESTRPAKQIVRLAIGATLSCEENQEFVNGSCLTLCENGTVRGDSGQCLLKEKECPEDKDLFNRECMDKCSDTEERNQFGSCVEIPKPKNDIVSKIATWIITIILIFIILSLIFKIRKVFIKRL